MRLWHYELIKYLPRSQLLAQWRELNSIFKNKPKHILINYVYDHTKNYLLAYSVIVINEMNRRKYKWSVDNLTSYFGNLSDYANTGLPNFPEHDDRYLLQCFYNLQEKYDRGQLDFTKEIYEKLEKFVFSD